MWSNAGSHNIVQKRCQFCLATVFGNDDGQPGTCWGCVDKRNVERETIARVVAWLRREAAKHNGPMPGVDPVGSVLVIADAIERGDWKGENGDG